MAVLLFSLLMLVVMVVPAAHAVCTVNSTTMAFLDGLPLISVNEFQGEWYIVRKKILHGRNGKTVESGKVKVKPVGEKSFEHTVSILFVRDKSCRVSPGILYKQVDNHYEQTTLGSSEAFFLDVSKNSFAVLEIPKNGRGDFLYNNVIISILQKKKPRRLPLQQCHHFHFAEEKTKDRLFPISST